MSDVGKTILSWWAKALDRDAPRGRALSARLRRATPVEVLCEPEVHALAQSLDLRDADRLVRMVTVLAEVRDHTNATLATRLGGADPVLSTLRFQRLLRASGDEIAIGLRRAIPMAGRACNVAALGQDLLFWGENTRTKWCFHYFGADAPVSESEEAPQ